jgi:hypothetical protein
MNTGAAKLETAETPSERVDRVWADFYGCDPQKAAPRRSAGKLETQGLTPANPPNPDCGR